MKPIRLILALLFGISTTELVPAVAQAAPKSQTVMQQGVEIYNSLKSARRLFAVMKIGAKPSDQKFLDELAAKYKDYALPKATLKDDNLYVEGIETPLRGVDPIEGSFYYNGEKVRVNLKAGIKVTFMQLEKALQPRPVSLLEELLLPSAHAVDLGKALMLIGGGVAGIVGLMNTLSCFNGGSSATAAGGGITGILAGGGGCMMGIGMDVLAAILLYFGLKHDDPPQGIACAPGGAMTIMGANGSPLGSVLPNGGVTGALSQVPIRTGSMMYGACSSPAMYGQINSAFAAPTLVSAPPIYGQVRPFGTTAIMSTAPARGQVGFQRQQQRAPSSAWAPGSLQQQNGAPSSR